MTRKVRGVVNYLGEMDVRPRYHAQDHARDNLVLDPREIDIEDMRDGDAPSLAREGFALVRHQSAVTDFNHPAAQPVYADEIAKLVREATGASQVVVTGKALLRFGEKSPLSGKRIPVQSSHSPIVAVIRSDRDSARRIAAPRRSWTRIHGSKSKPSARRQPA